MEWVRVRVRVVQEKRGAGGMDYLINHSIASVRFYCINIVEEYIGSRLLEKNPLCEGGRKNHNAPSILPSFLYTIIMQLHYQHSIHYRIEHRCALYLYEKGYTYVIV